MLGAAEEHTALSRALSQLAETEEKIEQLHKDQSEHDFYVMAELLKDYVALLGSVKVVVSSTCGANQIASTIISSINASTYCF